MLQQQSRVVDNDTAFQLLNGFPRFTDFLLRLLCLCFHRFLFCLFYFLFHDSLCNWFSMAKLRKKRESQHLCALISFSNMSKNVFLFILLSSPWGIRRLSFRHVPYCHPCVLPVFRQSSLWTSLSLSHRADRRIRTYHPLPLPVVSLSIHWAHWDPLRDHPHEESARETPGSAWGRCAYRLFLLLEA